MLKKKWTIIGACTAALMISILIVSINTVFFSGNEDISNRLLSNIISDLIGILICNIIYLVVFFDRRDNEGTHIFLILLCIETVLLFADIHSWVWDGDPSMLEFSTVMNYLTYLCVLFLVAVYWVFLRKLYRPTGEAMGRFRKYVLFLTLAGTALILTNPLTELYFYMDANAVYQRSDTFLVSLLAPNLIGLIAVYCIAKFEIRPRRRLVFLSYILLSWGAMVIQISNYGISLQYLSFMFSFVLMYANIYLDRGTELIVNEARMNEQSAAIMVSQIQPHFLYNALTSIMNIKGNPPETRDAIAEFGGYLRSNLDSIAMTNPVPIQREIEHVETYIYLRKLKFGDDLNIVYDIEDTSFFLPPQTIKTIMATMIEYNLEREKLPFTITLRTRNTDLGHIVTLHNDAVTVSARKYVSDEENPDIINMSSRLSNMVGGTIRNVIDEKEGLLTEIVVPHERRHQP